MVSLSVRVILPVVLDNSVPLKWTETRTDKVKCIENTGGISNQELFLSFLLLLQIINIRPSVLQVPDRTKLVQFPQECNIDIRDQDHFRIGSSFRFDPV